MKLFNLVILNVKSHVRKAYQNGNEAAYAAYRAVTGVSVQESWKVVKPWIREWRNDD
jgi:hypothetical protein